MSNENREFGDGRVSQMGTGKWMWEVRNADGVTTDSCFGFDTAEAAKHAFFYEMSDTHEGKKIVLTTEATPPNTVKAMAGKVQITINLSDDEAQALAQYLKRYIWTDVRKSAVNDDEAYLMRDAFNVIQRELSEAGYAPR